MRNNLKVLRAQRDMTQEDLARRSGLSRATVNAVENEAAVPNGETIVKLARALEVKAEDIFFDLDVV